MISQARFSKLTECKLTSLKPNSFIKLDPQEFYIRVYLNYNIYQNNLHILLELMSAIFAKVR